MTEPSPVPVTVIGGYLGAGKTTLLNRVLTGNHGRRLAVVVNDFGSVAVDEALLAPAAGGIRALANGCVCCTAVDGLGAALDELRALTPPPEHVLIEVSGVGDPWAVAQWGRTPGFVLDGVLVVADPGQIRDWVDDPRVGEGVAHQLSVADLVLLSHADITPAQELTAVTRWLTTVTDAPVLAGTDTPLDLLIGRGTGTDDRTPAPHADHLAWDVRPAPHARQELEAWLAHAPPTVVRAKGIVEASEDGADEWIAQLVGRRREVTRRRPPPTGEPVMTVIAFAGADQGEIERWLGRLTARPPAPPATPDR